MKNFSLSFLAYLLIFSFPSLCQETKPFVVNNKALFEILGKEQNYEFNSDNLGTRFNKGENQFEFVLPLETLVPVSDPLYLQILKDLFPSQYNPTLLLTAEMEDRVFSVDDFKKPVEMVLEGILTLNNKSIHLPVNMSVYANGDELYYNMRAKFNLDLLDKSYNGKYKQLITGEFRLLVNDAYWNEGLRKY